MQSGTEAVAESFYRVVEKQEMEGGQSNSVLMNCVNIDWSLPSVIQCDSALSDITINNLKKQNVGKLKYYCKHVQYLVYGGPSFSLLI